MTDADLVGLNRLSMDSSGHHRVRGDSESHPNIPVSVNGGKRPMLHRYMSKV